MLAGATIGQASCPRSSVSLGPPRNDVDPIPGVVNDTNLRLGRDASVINVVADEVVEYYALLGARLPNWHPANRRAGAGSRCERLWVRTKNGTTGLEIVVTGNVLALPAHMDLRPAPSGLSQGACSLALDDTRTVLRCLGRRTRL